MRAVTPNPVVHRTLEFCLAIVHVEILVGGIVNGSLWDIDWGKVGHDGGHGSGENTGNGCKSVGP